MIGRIVLDFNFIDHWKSIKIFLIAMMLANDCQYFIVVALMIRDSFLIRIKF